MSSLSKTGAAIIGQSSNPKYEKTKTLPTSHNLDESKLSKETFNDQFRQRNQKEFINEANKIMRERMKNKGSTINSKSRLKSVILKDTQEICLKNYLIDLLKAKRTDINEKEKNITKALRDSETRLDDDYKEFVDFVEETKREQKRREEKLSEMKTKLEELEKIQKMRLDDNKKFNEDLEKTIKILCLLKSYGAFVHKVLGIPFVYECIPDLDSREKKYDELAKVILRDYNKMMTSERPSILEDESLLILQFTQFEERVLRLLESKQIVDKDMKSMTHSYEEELVELKTREKIFLEEANRTANEENQIIASIKNLKTHKNSEVEQYLNYLTELGLDIGGTKERGKKKNIVDSLNFIRETLDTLSDKEKTVINFIKDIKIIKETDPVQFKMIVEDRTKVNRLSNQHENQKEKDILASIKRKRAIERGQRVVIKGRKVPQDYPILKGKTKKTNEHLRTDNNDYYMLNYSSDEN